MSEMNEIGVDASREAAVLRAAYAALNRGDVAGFVGAFDVDVVRVEPAGPGTEGPDTKGTDTAGTYRGLGAVVEHVAKGRGTWAERGEEDGDTWGCVPERFYGAGDRVVAVVRVRVRLKTETEWREGRIGDVFTFRDGKVVEFRTFWEVEEALRWAGVEDGGAG